MLKKKISSKVFVQHYSKTFATKAFTPERKQALATCLSIVPVKVMHNQCESCVKPLLVDDLDEALSQMQNNKAIGLNGFPYEFYKKLWDTVGPNLHKVYQEALAFGSLNLLINMGNIKLIPKQDNPEIITNQRPINLLNFSYKITRKALALRLRSLLPMIIRLEHISFIRNHYILDNVLSIWEGIEWPQSSQQNTMFIKIDFEKAYD